MCNRKCYRGNTPQYLSQMKSDLHKIFRIILLWSVKMIYDIKDDPILQDSSQEPSTSSKYGLQGQGVLDTLLIKLESWNLAHKSRITYHDSPWCQEWPQPPSIQSGTLSILQVWLQRQGVLDTLQIMLESWNLAHKSIIIYNDDPWCQWWPYPPRLQSETVNILQV